MTMGIRSRTSGIMIPAWVLPTSGLDTATQAWIAAVQAAGGSVSAEQRGYVNTLIVSLKGHGLFTQLECLFLIGGENILQQATIDIINLHTATKGPTSTLAAGGITGVESDTDNTFFDTGFTPSTLYLQDTASIGVYINQINDAVGGQTPMGIALGANARIQDNVQASGEMRTVINSGTVTNFANASALGMWILSRTGASAGKFYKNGTSQGAFSDTATATVSGSFSAQARHDGVTNYTNNTSNRISACFIGGALDDTQAANLANDINTYMTAWGINTY